MNIEKVVKIISNNVKNNTQENETDYMKDGLLYCGNCNTKKQRVLTTPWSQSVVYCLCKCEVKKREEKLAEERRKEELRYIENLKIAGIHDRNIYNYTFANSEDDAYIRKAKKYCEKWDEIYENNNGLLLWGGVGTGKTFFAGCIANELIENSVPVLMTSLSKIINDLQGFNLKDKNEYLNSINRFKLLILDDLGAERQSDFALEQVFSVIDSRYKNGQPVIITTNLSLNELKNPTDTKYKRIYDRILEMCAPLKFEGNSKRIEKSREKFNVLKNILEEE